MSDQPTKSKRERERAAMLEEALARPGVREVKKSTSTGRRQTGRWNPTAWRRGNMKP